MTRYVFPDNTVLVNFTLVDRHDLVEWIVRDQGAWGITVCRECARGAKVPGQGGMSRWRDLFGKPLAPTALELADAQVFAQQMRKPGENGPGKHMGEAETVAIVTRRELGATFLTDDNDARRLARSQGLKVVSTRWIIAMAEVFGKIGPDEAQSLLEHLETRGRHLGEPPSKDGYTAFVRDRKENR